MNEHCNLVFDAMHLLQVCLLHYSYIVTLISFLKTIFKQKDVEATTYQQIEHSSTLRKHNIREATTVIHLQQWVSLNQWIYVLII